MSSANVGIPTEPSQEAKRDLSPLRIDDHQRKSAGKGWLITALIAGSLVVAGAACGTYVYLHRAPVVEVLAVQRQNTDAPALLNASGYVTPQRRATVAAKITGRVTGVFFSEGQYVHQGTVLATLDDSDAQKTLATATANRNATQAGILDLQVQLENAQLQLHRAKALEADGIDTKEALDNAQEAVNSLNARIALTKAQVLASDAQIREAQQGVENCTIRAPFDGVIVTKDAQVGEMVSPISAGGGFTRTGIATIVDMNSNEVEVDVNESYIARVVPGQSVTAVLDAYPDWKILCHVLTIIPTADRDKATVKVRIAFDKLDPRILPDMGVKVSFLGKETKPSTGVAAGLVVPQSAIRKEGGQTVVYVVQQGRVERRSVRVGNTAGADAQILAGVAPGDSIVVRGPTSLQDGEAVAVNAKQ